MKNFLRAVSLLLAGVIMLIPFTSCSNSKRDEYGVIYNQKDTLVIGWPEDSSTDVLYDAWDDYCQLNGKNNLELEIVPESVLYDENRISSDETPDISLFSDQNLFAFAQDDYLLNLDEYNVSEIKTSFAENSWDGGFYKSSVYGIPFAVRTVLFSASKNDMDAENLKMPDTYGEWLTVGEKLKKSGKIMTDHYMFANFYSFVWRLGGEVLNEDGTEAVFNTPETGVRVFEMLLEMKEKGYIGKNPEEDLDVFSMLFTSTDLIGDMYNIGLQPELKEGIPRYSEKYVSSLCIKKSSVNKELAYDFIKFLSTEKNTVTGKSYQEETKIGIPTLKDVQDDMSKSSDFYKTYIEQLNCSKLRPHSIIGYDMDEYIFSAAEAVVYGRKTPEEAVKDAQKEINAAIRQKMREKESGR